MEEWLKRHRLLSAIGGVVGVMVATLAAVDVFWSLISDKPLLPYILENVPLWGRILLAIGFASLCIFCITIVVKVYRQGKKPCDGKPQIDSEETSELRQIPNTLTLMHHRIRQLREELAKRDIGKEKAIRLQRKMHKTFPVSDGIIKRVQRWQMSGQEVKFIRGVKLIDKLAIGNVYGSAYEDQICDMGGMLETEDVGLKPILSSDTDEYVSLKNRLEMQYAGAPESISRPILKYERYLYGLSSVFVWNAYRIRYLGESLPIRVEAKVTQYNTQAEDKMLNKLKEDVVKAINEYLE